MAIPHWAPPTHAMQIFRYAEQGSIELPVGLGDEPGGVHARAAADPGHPGQTELFLVVQDLYLTETAQYADVVLPAAGWGEKTGTFTNVDRIVHLSDKAVDPPGEARSDLDIFLDYARRMDFTHPDGRPAAGLDRARGRLRGLEGVLPRPARATTPASATTGCAAAAASPGRATRTIRTGTDRLYSDGVFPTDPDYCESYGHDLLTGATVGAAAFRAQAPGGRAILKAAPSTRRPHEEPDEDYPLRYTTGRTAYHFHTRTKTGRARQLTGAAPRPGWNCPRRTQTGSASPKATWSG